MVVRDRETDLELWLHGRDVQRCREGCEQLAGPSSLGPESYTLGRGRQQRLGRSLSPAEASWCPGATGVALL